MALMVWSKDLDTGIGVIDAQHQRLLGIINQLRAARGRDDRQVVSEALDNLVDYTLFHFAFEETMLEQANYALTEDHRRLHAAFVVRVEDQLARFRAGQDVSEELEQSIAQWLFRHIRIEDHAYVQDVKSALNAHKP